MEYILLTTDALLSMILIAAFVGTLKKDKYTKNDVVAIMITAIISLSNTIYVWNHIGS